LRIDLSPEILEQLCAALNEFALPRAIVDFEQGSFVAWNPKFLDKTGLSPDELKSSRPEDLLTFGESWFPISQEAKGQEVECVDCATKRPSGGDLARGYAVRSGGKLCYVMLDAFDSATAEFEQGRTVGREEERNRVVREFHDEVSSSLFAALFLIQTAKVELENAGLPQAAAVSKASEILTETSEKIVDVLTAEPNSE
jgi:PAS domain-containing protein